MLRLAPKQRSSSSGLSLSLSSGLSSSLSLSLSLSLWISLLLLPLSLGRRTGAEGLSATRLSNPRHIFLKTETINAQHQAERLRVEELRAARAREYKLRAEGVGAEGSVAEVPEGLYLVHLQDAGSAAARAKVERVVGVRLRSQIPHNTYLINLSAPQLLSLRTLLGAEVVWFGKFRPRHKYLPSQMAVTRKGLNNETQGLYVRVAGSAEGVEGSVAHRVEGLRHHLLEAGFGGCEVRAAGKTKVLITKHRGDPHWYVPVAQAVSTSEEVVWIEAKPEFQLRNKYAAANVQGGSRCPPCTTAGCPTCAHTPDRIPIWNYGLRGDGEVVGCGDTGIDVDSCLFWDDSGGSRPSPPFAPEISATHRKIVSYNSYADATDEKDGHGTHVVGSILGSIADTQSDSETARFSGMAPNARIAFFDIMGAGDSLVLPDEMEDVYFKWSYNAGARVHSNSWGDTSTEYTLTTKEVDSFVYDNPDMLVLFAAGNDGDMVPPEGTIGAPATCKNCLAVGASQGEERDAVASGGRLIVYVEPSDDGAFGDEVLSATGASFGPEIEDGKAIEGEFTFDCFVGLGCEALNASLAGKIALIERGECFFSDKVANAQIAGAIAVVIYNNVPGSPIAMGMGVPGPEVDIDIPSVMISQADGEFLYNYSASAPNEAIELLMEISKLAPEFNRDNLADFSSWGPTSDGRLKPDIVAPGEDIFSAHSDGKPYSYQCRADTSQDDSALIKMSGTSMSCPVAAGAATLVRQYFRTGKYAQEAGAAGNWMGLSTGFNPSAALLRAVILNGAVPLTGQKGSSGPELAPPPSMAQGYGKLNLLTSIKTSVVGSPDLAIMDGLAGSIQAQIHQGETKKHCITVGSSSTPLKVTLTWTDPPGEPYVEFALVNNLDLAVFRAGSEADGGVLLYGNHRLNSQCDGDNCNQPDHLNNNEQVYIASPRAGDTYEIYVVGQKIGFDDNADGIPEPQKYSIAVTGSALTALSDSQCSTACPNGCGGHGTCSAAGTCSCSGIWNGIDCSVLRSCDSDCSGHGSCDTSAGTCVCEPGWSGDDCSLFSCAGGEVTKVLVPDSGPVEIHSSMGQEYAYSAACAWEISPQDPESDLTAVVTRLDIESSWGFFPTDPGCDGSLSCSEECKYDGLHVIGGSLPADTHNLVSDDEGQPCHTWAKGLPNYLGSFCGYLADMTGGDALPVSFSDNTFSLVFCSDEGVEFDGFTIKATAIPCPGNCSGHGECVDHECKCEHGYRGYDCKELVFGCDLIPARDGQHTIVEPCPPVGNFDCILENRIASNAENKTFETQTAGICICQEGYAGERCDQEHCAGFVNVTWAQGTTRDHVNLSHHYHPDSECTWLFDPKLQSHEVLRLNVTFIDLEWDFDFLKMSSPNWAFEPYERPTAANRRSRGPETAREDELVAVLTGGVMCAAKDGIMVDYLSGRGEGCSMREWSWMAFDVPPHALPLTVTFKSDASKEAGGVHMSWRPAMEALEQPFVQMSIFLDEENEASFEHKLAKFAGVVSMVVKVPLRNVRIHQIITAKDAGEGAIGRRPHEYSPDDQNLIEVEFQVLADVTDAPHPVLTGIYQRLVSEETISAIVDNLMSTGFQNVSMGSAPALSFTGTPLKPAAAGPENVVQEVVEIIKHASDRDAGFFVGGIVLAVLLSCLGAFCWWIKNRYFYRQRYIKSLDEVELEPVDLSTPNGGRRGSDGMVVHSPKNGD